MTESDKKDMNDCYMAEIRTNALRSDANTAKAFMKGYESALNIKSVSNCDMCGEHIKPELFVEGSKNLCGECVYS